MFDIDEIREFGTGVTEHAIYASAAGTATFAAQTWHLLPFEALAVLFGAIFVAVKVGIEHCLRRRIRHKEALQEARRRAAKQRHPRKLRTSRQSV